MVVPRSSSPSDGQGIFAIVPTTDDGVNCSRLGNPGSKKEVSKTADQCAEKENDKMKDQKQSLPSITCFNKTKRARLDLDNIIQPAKGKENSPHFPAKRAKRPTFIVRAKEIQTFLNLLDDAVIQEFLQRDKCMRISDKYLIAMVFAYFKRASLTIKEFTKMHFFMALYLANDMEEDEEDFKYEIFPWALGKSWRDRYPAFLRKKDKLWQKMGFRAAVTSNTCEEIMAIKSEHPIWTRERPEFHSGALRSHLRNSDDDGYPRGPDATPRRCANCDAPVEMASDSPTAWYLSSCSDSSPDSEPCGKTVHVVPGARFDMTDLQQTLQDEDSVWARADEFQSCD